MDSFFVTAKPEEVGIASQQISQFLDKLAEHNICMHSILLVRNGKLAYETYYAPYEADTLHRMFSVTKSFMSLAIGLLEADGKLTLDDRIIDHFPEKLPSEGAHPYLAKLTIREMLMMATCHSRTTYKRTADPDWVKSFFVVEPTHLPGTVFSYDTSSSHTLGGLVEKLTGMSALDYLREKFLNMINFSKDAYIIPDPMGVSMGGSGLMATPLDLAKVAWIVMNNGRYQEKQVLPAQYLQAAVAKQIDTTVRGNNLDEKLGYGYQFWRIRRNGYAMLGMGGQIAACFPEKNLLLVTTADTQENASGVPVILESFFELIYDNISDEPLPENPSQNRILEIQSQNNAIQPLEGIDVPEIAVSVANKEYYFDENPMGLEKLRLQFNDLNGSLYFTNQLGDHVLNFGLGEQVIDEFPYYGYRSLTSGAWVFENTFVIKSHIIDYELGMITIQLGFKQDTVSVVMKKVLEYGLNEFSGFASSREEIIR